MLLQQKVSRIIKRKTYKKYRYNIRKIIYLIQNN